MIKHPSFTVEEWKIHETELNLDILAQTESVFALSNGHIGLRGNLDEGEPYGLPGTYLNSFYELRPLPYAEGGYGYPESGQAIVNVTNGKIIRLLVDDTPFDVRYGLLQSHERELDLRAGVLHRTVNWVSPTGRSIKVSSTRMVSFTQRAIAAISYEVEPIDSSVRIVLQSELVANEALPDAGKDPRAGTVSLSPLEGEEHEVRNTRGLLVHHTQASSLRMGAAMDHQIEGPKGMTIEAESTPDIARVSVSAQLRPGERLRIIKFLAYGWSSQRSRSAISDQIIAALSAARSTGWEGLLAEQRGFLNDFWKSSNIEIEGDAEVQQALRFALFHVLQAGCRGEQRPIPAKGLTGPGYDGHTFWDTEICVLPALILTLPRAAADVLRWRHSTLHLAKERARQLGLRGAAFPWRTIHGEASSSYWPAGTAAFHINADIAYAVTHYIESTEDRAFEKEIGLELLVETARLWRSLGFLNVNGEFRIDGVTGPDEYSALVDNNVYTNLMAQHNLRSAAEAAKRHPHVARALGVHAGEIASWSEAAEKMFIPYDKSLNVTPQDDAFTSHEVWNFADTKTDHYPLLLYFPYFDLYRKQVVKQADLVLAMHLRGDAFTAEQKARNFAYYEPLTVRDSSLSASTQAVIAAEVGQLQLAYDYLAEVAFMDLYDLEHNTRDGLHIASLVGTWSALVAGFGGMRLYGGSLAFAPRLPESVARLAFRILFRNRCIYIEVTATDVRYSLIEGSPLAIWHHGDKLALSTNEAVIRPIPRIKVGPRPTQPPGRAPVERAAQSYSCKTTEQPHHSVHLRP
ncbi:glycoside hydrolase family 65 protein [Dictyobacter aurantiacus]|uniref:Glycosyl hydrolase n=1 Tax=Dictyobacter aurantiacus TaxID=1936993 RepID=A0A401ZM11_9CHLR|nr:glycosyl hydrolase family 65 protein [Dictyobacter aurantiacus]GCE07917.1 glycosyl hydrolase [Dictyobacter aurantiacus]